MDSGVLGIWLPVGETVPMSFLSKGM
jgi:hypothetical protein